MLGNIRNRCINIDWLEVYCLESNHRFPCNVDYYEKRGYKVRDRGYGTRVYQEMFEILNENEDPIIEIRRNPASGSSDFNGLTEFSTHIRLTNWVLYQDNPIDLLRTFLVDNDYIFKRIFRIDIAYDFEYFDSGDLPARFARRYLQGAYRKINQCFLSAHGQDKWAQCEWQSLSWGSKSSMVTTKLYNKTLELKEAKYDKPYIKTTWMIHGLIDNPMSMTKFDDKGNLYEPDIWRVEFSMKSDADGWIVLEFNRGIKMKKQAVPHKLSLFDTKEKLWQRFQDLAYNYFHFKHKDYINERPTVTQFAMAKIDSHVERKLQRKDRCRDKVLFLWDKGHQFMQLSAAPSPTRKKNEDEMLRRKLIAYQNKSIDLKVKDACQLILDNIDHLSSLKYIPMGDSREIQAIRMALAARLGGNKKSAFELIAEIKEILANDLIY